MDSWIEIISKVRRPSLGDKIPLLIFRAFRLYTGNYLKDIIGNNGAITLLQNAGRELGKEVGESMKEEELDKYLIKLADFVRDVKVGLLVPSEVSKERLVVQIDECITCSGMPNIGARICHFEAGFVGGAVEVFTGKKVRVQETKCNANGEGICEVTVDIGYAQGK